MTNLLVFLSLYSSRCSSFMLCQIAVASCLTFQHCLCSDLLVSTLPSLGFLSLSQPWETQQPSVRLSLLIDVEELDRVVDFSCTLIFFSGHWLYYRNIPYVPQSIFFQQANIEKETSLKLLVGHIQLEIWWISQYWKSFPKLRKIDCIGFFMMWVFLCDYKGKHIWPKIINIHG